MKKKLKLCTSMVLLVLAVLVLFSACPNPTDTDNAKEQYTITYETNGGEGKGTIQNGSVQAGESYTVSACNFTKEDYFFISWNTKADGTGTSYAAYERIAKVTSNLTLYAQWEKGVVLSFNANGGTGTMDSIVVQKGQSHSVPHTTFTHTNLNLGFAVWNTSADGTGTSYGVSENITLSSDLTLYAQWSQKYTITYELNGGTNHGGNPTYYTKDSLDFTLKSPTQNGCEFLGWYENESFSGNPVIQITKGTTGNKTFYAKWSVKYSDFASVPGGTYTQTTAKYDSDTTDGAFSHTISPFHMAKYQVTYELWYIVRTWAESNDRGEKQYSFANKGMEGSVTGGGDWPNYTNEGKAPTTAKYEPVTMVNWRDCIIWCNAYSEMSGLTPVYYTDSSFTTPLRASTNGSDVSTTEGSEDNPYVNWTANGYRLPTEGEWQYAASYIDGTNWTSYDYASGASARYKNADACKEVAWYSANSNSKTQAVGGKKANALDIFDMSGNVSEWCWDWYSSCPTTAQTDYRGAASGFVRILRGDSWGSDAARLRVGHRSTCDPYFEDVLGFRLARSAQ